MEKKFEWESRNIENVKSNEKENFVTGKAIVFNTPQVVYKDRFGNEYREIIDSHALDDLDIKDVPLVYNHSDSKAQVLARQRDKSLMVEKKPDGVYFQAELRSNLGKDVYNSIKAGDINGCSFRFHCSKDKFDSKTNTRTVLKIDRLGDLSIVDDQAYKDATVEARGYYQGIEKAKELEQEKRKKLILLSMI